MWIAQATVLAKGHPIFPHRGSKVSRRNAEARKAMKRRRRTRGTAPSAIEARPPALGGHRLTKVGTWWKCECCLGFSQLWAKLASQRCEGSAAKRWAVNAMTAAKNGTVNGGRIRGPGSE